MFVTDTSYPRSIPVIPTRSASLARRLWAEIYFEIQVCQLRRQIVRELNALPDRLLEDMGTFRGEIHAYADRAARQWLESQIAQNTCCDD